MKKYSETYNNFFLIAAVVILITALFLKIYQKFSFQEIQINIPVVNINYQKNSFNSLPKTESKEITFIGGGDIMLSREVGNKMFKAKNFTLPFINIYKIFSEADIAFANLESPFYDKGPRITQGLIFKSEPETISGLLKAGIDLLSLANNHIMNQGMEGAQYTLNLLKKDQIKNIGADLGFEKTHQGEIIRRGDSSFGFLAYSYTGFNDFKGAKKIVVAEMNLNQLKKDIFSLKEKTDIIIVSMHAGEEYTHEPNSSQISFAKSAIDYGAKIVLGHHPHVVQNIEKYKDGYIFYSLGNLIMDQEWSRETKEGLIAKIIFQEKKIKKIELIPVIIENYSTPRLANKEEIKKILKDINLSDTLILNNP